MQNTLDTSDLEPKNLVWKVEADMQFFCITGDKSRTCSVQGTVKEKNRIRKQQHSLKNSINFVLFPRCQSLQLCQNTFAVLIVFWAQTCGLNNLIALCTCLSVSTYTMQMNANKERKIRVTSQMEMPLNSSQMCFSGRALLSEEVRIRPPHVVSTLLRSTKPPVREAHISFRATSLRSSEAGWTSTAQRREIPLSRAANQWPAGQKVTAATTD